MDKQEFIELATQDEEKTHLGPLNDAYREDPEELEAIFDDLEPEEIMTLSLNNWVVVALVAKGVHKGIEGALELFNSYQTYDLIQRRFIMDAAKDSCEGLDSDEFVDALHTGDYETMYETFRSALGATATLCYAVQYDWAVKIERFREKFEDKPQIIYHYLTVLPQLALDVVREDK